MFNLSHVTTSVTMLNYVKQYFEKTDRINKKNFLLKQYFWKNGQNIKNIEICITKKKQWYAVHIKTRIDSTNISLILNISIEYIDISTNMVNAIVA